MFGDEAICTDGILIEFSNLCNLNTVKRTSYVDIYYFICLYILMSFCGLRVSLQEPRIIKITSLTLYDPRTSMEQPEMNIKFQLGP